MPPKKTYKPIVLIRSEVMEFAEAMERMLRKHDAKKGDRYKRPSGWSNNLENFYGEILSKLENEVSELISAHADPDGDPDHPTTAEDLKNESVDVANIAMFAWLHAVAAVKQLRK